MSRVSCSTLTEVLMRPEQATSITMQQWDLLLRQAREAGLLSRLALTLQAHKLLAELPDRVVQHLESSIVYAERQQQVVRWEVRCIQAALTTAKQSVVLLKGAAYVIANLPAARGRVFADIDLLTDKSKLDKVEQALFAAGWVTTHHDTYDQRYYRQWMHELPPMQHIQRRSVLDVHHNILPETARANPDAKLLLENIECVDERKGIYVLSTEDRIIHSATHLFFDGEFEHGLRDLLDMHDLMIAANQKEGFWESLLSRARQLTLSRPLYYALTQVKRLYQTPVPDGVISELRKQEVGLLRDWLMKQVFHYSLLPPHSSCRSLMTSIAMQFLYLRAHYLRMPLHLLIPHLTRKAFRSDDK